MAIKKKYDQKEENIVGQIKKSYKKIILSVVVVFVMSIFMRNTAVFANTSNAISINLNQKYTGVLKDDYQEDYYKITLKEAGNVSLSIKQQANMSWEGTIEDSNENIYTTIDTNDSAMVSGNAVSQVGLPKGTYYIKISDNYNTENVKYEFSINYTKSGTYEKEFNNTLVTANPISLNKSYTGVIQNYDDMDFYKFTTTVNGNVSLSIKNQPNMQWFAQIIDSKGTIYETLESEDSELVDGSKIVQVGIPKGTYFVKVSNNYATIGTPYSLKVGFEASDFYEKETNNNLTNANAIQVNQIYKGQIKDYSDEDFFKFTIPNDGNIKLSLDNMANTGWQATLFNNKGEVYQTLYTEDSELVDGNTSANIGLPKGTYYVKIENYSDSLKKTYQFKVSYKKSDFYEKEFNNSLTSATFMKLNNTYYGSRSDNSDSDKDIYKITLPRDGQVTVRMTQLPGVIWTAKIQNSTGVVYHSLETNDSEMVSGNASASKMMKKGTYYLVVEGISSWNSDRYLDYGVSVSLYSSPLSASQIKVTNNKAANDKVVVSGITKGDTVKIYNASSKGQLLGTKKATGSSVTMDVKQLGKKAGKVYVTITHDGMLESNRVASSFSGEESDSLKATQATIVNNNKGKKDTIKVTGVTKGDTLKVYNASKGGKLLVSKQVKGTSDTLTLNQLGTKAGKVYISITRSGMKESKRTAVSYKGEQTTALKTTQVTITNNKGKNDTIKVTKITKGDIIKVYNASKGGKMLLSKQAKGTTDTLTLKQLGTKAGKVYISIQRSGMVESTRTTFSYKGEQTTALKAKQVHISNNKGKSDTIKVTGITKGATIRVYNASKGGKLLVSKQSKGTTDTLMLKQLGKKAGKVYLSVTISGMSESARTSVAYKAE